MRDLKAPVSLGSVVRFEIESCTGYRPGEQLCFNVRAISDRGVQAALIPVQVWAESPSLKDAAGQAVGVRLAPPNEPQPLQQFTSKPAGAFAAVRTAFLLDDFDGVLAALAAHGIIPEVVAAAEGVE